MLLQSGCRLGTELLQNNATNCSHPPVALQSQVLGKYYWLGLARAKPGALFTYVDGSAVPNTITSGKPYVHW